MNIDSQITWKGKEAILAAHETLGKTNMEIAIMFQADAKLLCSANTGILRSSIEIATEKGIVQANKKGNIPDISIPPQGVIHSGTAMPYAAHAEYGTGPHKKAQGSEQFVASITDWAKRKGIKNVGGLIRSIRRKGTKPHPFLRPAFDRISGKFVSLIQDEATKQWKVATDKYMNDK